MQKILVAVALFLGVVFANAFSNGGFESNTCGSTSFCEYGGSEIPSWTVTSATVDLTNIDHWNPNDGDWSLDVAGASDGTIVQSFDTTTGNEYQVGFALSGNPEGGNLVKTLVVGASGTATQTYTFNVGYFRYHPITDMSYTSESFRFTGIGSSSTVSFQSVGNGAYGPVIDSVTVTELTPAQVCAQFSFTNPGYFCGTNNSGFYQCMNGAWAALSAWQNCAAGTTCACDYGVECSNGGTESPCRDSNPNK